jgi:hypothetical protein
MTWPRTVSFAMSAIRRSVARLNSRNPASVSSRWVRPPGSVAGVDLCLFVTFSPTGRVTEPALVQARTWAAQGFAVVLILVVDDLALFDPDQDLDFCRGLFVRANIGYDFGAWAAAMRDIPDLRQARSVAIANDSVYGPFDSFAAMLDRVRASPADIVGLTESHEIRPHFQSFVMFFKHEALRSRIFHRFWRGVRNGDRQWVIEHYELQMVSRFVNAGLSAEALFPSAPGEPANPTLSNWRALIRSGFPFIKVQLLRDNPLGADLDGWQDVVAERGFDPALIERHLAGVARARACS